jgi:transposase-like protein
MVTKKNLQKESYWRGMISRQENSGLSIREFCDQQGISVASMYGWRKELKKRSPIASGDSTSTASTRDRKPKPKVTEAVAPSTDFISIQLEQLRPALELLHPRGYQLRIPNGFDTVTLQQTIEVLDAIKEA